jgi:hypothetical protein
MGAVTVLLTVWDIHNSFMIESMGMAWDTGAPIWPYQTSDILLRFLNFPAYFFAVPIANVLRLAAPKHHLLVLPSALVWWWLLGRWLDHGLMIGRIRRRWSFYAVLLVLSALLLWVATSISATTLHWWLQYGGKVRNDNELLMMLRFLTPAIWCCALVFLLAVAMKKGVGAKLS